MTVLTPKKKDKKVIHHKHVGHTSYSVNKPSQTLNMAKPEGVSSSTFLNSISLKITGSLPVKLRTKKIKSSHVIAS